MRVMNRVKQERINKGLPQTEAAKLIGISSGMLAMIEIGKRRGSDEVKKKIAKFYGKSVGYLFFNETLT
ncbi:helix-turn-helix transcriptional regulator [Listeria monocytogenes]|nr:hypothetical protein AXF54_03205 [Listeria monocytogenes]EHJ4860085.1 helix-turn-helix transcriptional regulator [Listeria monocytogenes]EHJ4894361.1 helix-turn-helix transcriptional regulator [Listeria monocytogenes]EHJ4897473.1 helix-turn-helix transcriptional regulator [Listeria monocytogenes]EHL2532060.1 helix-turn-helix transcriptional regulator [Listeria monocytogenes]